MNGSGLIRSGTTSQITKTSSTCRSGGEGGKAARPGYTVDIPVYFGTSQFSGPSTKTKEGLGGTGSERYSLKTMSTP